AECLLGVAAFEAAAAQVELRPEEAWFLLGGAGQFGLGGGGGARTAGRAAQGGIFPDPVRRRLFRPASGRPVPLRAAPPPPGRAPPGAAAAPGGSGRRGRATRPASGRPGRPPQRPAAGGPRPASRNRRSDHNKASSRRSDRTCASTSPGLSAVSAASTSARRS